MKMKRLLLCLMLLGVWLPGLLMAQTYEDGSRHYKKAELAERMGDIAGKQKALEDAFNTFKPLASKNDYKSLIMYFLLSDKLGKPFPLQDDLFYYVKDEHENFSTIEQMNFYGDDKTFILDKLKEIARQNEQQAKKLLDEAGAHVKLEEYQEALDKLIKVERLWNFDGTAILKTECSRLIKEKERESSRIKIEDFINRGQYQDARYALNNTAAVFTPGERSGLEKKIKEKEHDQLLKDARREFKKKDYYSALNKVDTAYGVIPSKEAARLKQKIEKKINRKQKRTFWVFSADFGKAGKHNMDLLNYNWTGNSNVAGTVTDSGTVKALPVDDKTYNYSLGLTKMFSPTVGLSASVSFLKESLTVPSDYKFSWVWWNGKSASTTATMSDAGEISLVPINLNLLVALNMGGGLSFNLFGGPTLFLTKIDLGARIGYGGLWLYGDYIYAEWFPFEYEIKDNGSYFGGNMGIDLEYKASSYYSIYVGFQYFLVPQKKLQFKLIGKSYPGQIWENTFNVGNPYELPNLPEYSTKLNLSNYQLHAGIKLYL